MSAPESWESIEDDSPVEPSKPIGLNVGASAFVPGRNVHAMAFVPRSVTTAQDRPEPEQARSNGASSSPQYKAAAAGAIDAKEASPVEDVKVQADSQPSTMNERSSLEPEVSDQPAEPPPSEPVVEAERPAAETAPAASATSSAAAAAPKASQASHHSEDSLDNINIVFIGHVDAGKSTIGGHLMYLTGQVDKRTLEKYEKEAKEKNRESWYLSWALDTNMEEREKGKTVEVGRASFTTERKHFTILDAPGHRSFVPNMIGGAAQADVAILVISARRGEFETGFERGGQTREHAMLAKTAGVKHLVVLINKMDDQTVQWSEERYTECKNKLLPYLKQVGFRPKTDVYFMPVSGLTGAGLKNRVDPKHCQWYSGPSFIEYLDDLPSISRHSDGPVRIPIVDRYKDMGTIIMGKVESGSVAKGQQLVLMPNKVNVEVLTVFTDEQEVTDANTGDNIRLKLKGIEEEDVSPGFVLCSPGKLCHTTRVFDAQVVVLEYKSIICAGYSAVLHVHTAVEDVKIIQLICTIDKKTGQKKPRPRFIKQDMQAIVRFETSGSLCLETFKDFQRLGRFTLRDEGRSVAVGKVLKLISS